jgi:hypothetical protein
MQFLKQIILQPKNPLDLKPEEVKELADSIRTSYPKYDVRVEGGSGYIGYGVTWFQILTIWLLVPINKQIVERITKLAIEWARQRFGKQKAGRPKSITIYGPYRKVLKSIVIKNATDEPEDRTDLNSKYRLRPAFKAAFRWHFLRRLWSWS